MIYVSVATLFFVNSCCLRPLLVLCTMQFEGKVMYAVYMNCKEND